MSTPIFEQTVAASDSDLHKASTVFPQPSTHWSVAAQYLVRPNPVDDPTRQPWPLEGTRITYEAEPKWRTFMRCLGWWKR